MKKLTISISMLWLFLFFVTAVAQNITDYLTANQQEALAKVVKKQNPKLYNKIFNSDEQIGNSNTRVTKIANIEEGGITQTLVEEWISNAWINETLWSFTFELGSNTSTTLQHDWENDQWVDKYFDTTIMDNQQNPIEDVTQKWENNEWKNFSKMMMQYNDNNDMTEMIMQSWNDTTKTWINDMRITYTHDNNFNVIEDLMDIWETDSWVGFQKGIFTYNSKNLVTNSLNQMWFDTEWMDMSKIVYTYNAKDLLIDQLNQSLNFMTSTFVTSFHWTYEYNDQDQEIVRLIEEFDIYTSARTGYTKMSTTYTGEYVAEEITQHWAGSDWENDKKDVYTYEDDQLTVALNQIWENNDWVNELRWKYTYGGATDVADQSEIPTEFKLNQNYPNPFNPSTTISYSIPSSVISNGERNLKDSSPLGIRNDNSSSYQSVRLNVYDIIGREVATLVNYQQQPGNYEVTFDASKYSSGIYYYSLSVGEFKQTKKCILIK